MIFDKFTKPLSIPKDENFYKAEMGSEFPLKNYITKTYGYAPCFLNVENSFTSEILTFLIKNGEIINYYSNGKIENFLDGCVENFNGGYFLFKYKETFVKLTIKNLGGDISFDDEGEIFIENKNNFDKKNKKRFFISISAPSNIKKYPIEDFLPFVCDNKEDVKVHLFIKNQYGEYTFEPIAVHLPENLDLESNYGKNFLDIDEKVQQRLLEKPNGLFMFHGLPGTGKTTYIKYLAGKVKRDFIYIPTTMIEHFTSDPNCLHTLIQKPNSVIILEDAEKAILKRLGDGMDSSAVSSLLNLSDGILSDILKTTVIVTYNCPKQDVDDALKRKGRLQMDYEFTALKTEDAINLAKKLKYPKKLIEEKINKPLTLSEIYNLEKDIEFYGEAKKEESKRIGFKF
jgi:hypothetical protein